MYMCCKYEPTCVRIYVLLPPRPSPSQCSLLYFSMLPLPLLLFPMEASFLIDGELWAALWQFWLKVLRSSAKADSTLRSSRAVPHPSTDRALRRLTSEVGRDPVHSTRYGRQRKKPSKMFFTNASELSKLLEGRPALSEMGKTHSRMSWGLFFVSCAGSSSSVLFEHWPSLG